MSASNARLSFMFAESQEELYQPKTLPSLRRPTKRLERRIISAWKLLTRATRKNQRNSVLPEGFVLMTNRRRSVMWHGRSLSTCC